MKNNLFPANLSRIRKERNLSQEALAQQLSISRQSISKWETGDSEPDMSNLQQLAKILDVGLDELVLGIVPKTTHPFSDTIAKFTTPDESDKDWHENHRWRQWQYSQVNNGWEWLARYYWVLFGLVCMVAWFLFRFFGKTM
ncbi:helix-turn-helix domain-containing protein [Secundilactobacillus kimchicus]|uniref:helix-turn-helix domain-containing protein n=1 Tax=Secundilactobacillus kimchicus TaxID=528209 RepID=UPI0024A9FBF4|nr:helix-turn-helix transcriptional regulator [Secundilactobacillus kimchicus]